MKFLKNRRLWRNWVKKEFAPTWHPQPPREFPCYGIATTSGPYYLYKSEVGDMQMKLAMSAMESPI